MQPLKLALPTHGGGNVYPAAVMGQWFRVESKPLVTTLTVLLLDRYGPEYLQWGLDTVRMEIQDDFAVTVDDVIADRIAAGMSLLTTEYFFTDLPRFIQLSNVLAGDQSNPGEFNPADVDEAAWAVTEAMLLNPPPEDQRSKNPFSPEIKEYVVAILTREGFRSPPGPLRIIVSADEFGGHVPYDFSDDPLLFSAVEKTQRDRDSAVDELVADQLGVLMKQLGSLKLQHGDARKVVEAYERQTAQLTQG